MDDKRRRRRDFIQNIVITVLAVSAALLFARTQLYSLRQDGLLSVFSGNSQPSGASVTVENVPLSAPVRIAVTGPYGRYGSITSVIGGDETLRGLLREVLGSTGTFTGCGQADFLNALQTTSVYFDFLSPLPLSVLADICGTSGPDSPSVRCLAVSGGEDPVSLFLWDGGDTYLRCSTAVSLKNLEQTAGQYETGGAVFATDLAKSDPHAGVLAPCSLFLNETPELPALSAETPAYDDGLLLAGLGFNPNTKNRYTDNGTEVISESGRSLRLRPDGNITYQSGGDSTLSIKAAGERPTIEESAAGVWALLNTLLAPTAGDEALYLTGIRQSGALTTLTFGYQVGGVPVRFSDGRNAAEVTLNGTAVSALSLYLRRYTQTESGTLLLPLRQALAIADRCPGAELSIGYADHGGTSVEAGWLAD